MNNKFLYIVLLLLGTFILPKFITAQNSNKFIRKGNNLYEEKDFKNAEIKYLKALEKDSTFVKGLFNRADALYEQQNYEEASKIFAKLTKQNLSKENSASVWHNLGNTMLQGKKYKNAIGSYQNALRNNPSDNDSKYNLVYAMEKLKEQQNKDKNKNKDKDKDKDKKQDK
ncbi:MAG: tetratricopeptide repeat protein, partial [Bacteroidota bacterium]|nr:tetratricopeptide repeat protein [Bacteroidota bacterium]